MRYPFGKKLSVCLLIAFWVLLFGCLAEEKGSQLISYNAHIRPILSDKCFTCHGPDANQRKANLRLDIENEARKALKSGEGFALVPGEPKKSLVYQRIISEDQSLVMPPPDSHLSLEPEEKSLLKEWIRQGAQYEKHWSFIPPTSPFIPETGKEWARNEIDKFTFSKMQEKGLSPSDEENPFLLLRRMTHDITGLPPTLEEQSLFVDAVDQDKAYAEAVEKALSSPHYGEKMAILWMDIARYADSHGYQDDGLRTMWPWRDWVIHAFNENYSYKKFITWQLAGDLLTEANKESILATGFNRNHKITQEGGVIDEEYRIEYVTDRTNTFSKGILAMTFECAKCHDHKYDPISQKDYFSTFAFFNQVPEKGFNGDISIFSLADPPKMKITSKDIQESLPFVQAKDTGMVEVMVMQDDTITRPTYVLGRGQYDQPDSLVYPRTPESIMPFDSQKYDGNRAGLAGWLFDEKNPLTARVFVNLVWQEFFGQGIVATAGDFGLQGDYPSHPELLDWLAVDFRTHGWDIKRLITQIVTSSTYRQSQYVDNKRYKIDPENIYLARGPRLRLKAELLRDHILASAGLLNKNIGGPSVKPYQPEGLWELASSGRGQLRIYEQDHGEDLYRRGIYMFIKRTVPPPSMLTFDASNRDQCEVSRQSTSTPLQALVLLNDPHILEASRYLAQTLGQQAGDPSDILTSAFQKIVCRPPSDKEKKILNSYFSDVVDSWTDQTAEQLLAVGEVEAAYKDGPKTAALMQSIQMIYNLEETSMR